MLPLRTPYMAFSPFLTVTTARMVPSLLKVKSIVPEFPQPSSVNEALPSDPETVPENSAFAIWVSRDVALA